MSCQKKHITQFTTLTSQTQPDKNKKKHVKWGWSMM